VLGAKSSEILEVFNRRGEKSPNFPDDSARPFAPPLDVNGKIALARERFARSQSIEANRNVCEYADASTRENGVPMSEAACESVPPSNAERGRARPERDASAGRAPAQKPANPANSEAHSTSKADVFRRFAQRVSLIVGAPVTFIAAVVLILVWAATGPFMHYSETWQLIINTGTTILTFLMVFLIQNTQNRDARAIQLKLDELIKGSKGARNQVIDLENCTDEELMQLEKEFKRLRSRETDVQTRRTEAKEREAEVAEERAVAEEREARQTQADAR
jgi:low affinity Fe/Cu permease